MGAMINIHFDSKTITQEKAVKLTQGVQQVVSEAMDNKDIFVYTNSPLVSAAIEPIEVFIQVNQAKVDDPAALTEHIAGKLAAWKEEIGFTQSINVNVIPVEWHYRIGI